MKNILWVSTVGLLLYCFSACGAGGQTEPIASDGDSIYQLSNILKIAFKQPELAIKRFDTCEMKGINSVDSICFYRGTIYGLLKNSDKMFEEYERILFREGANVNEPLYLHVLKTEASMKNNRNQNIKALEYCLLGDSLARVNDNELFSLQFRVLAADIGNESFVQKENIEKCVDESIFLLNEKRTFNIHLFFRDDLYDAYCRYNPFASEEDIKDNQFLYDYTCETKKLIDQVVETLHNGKSNEVLDYKYIQCYNQMVELLVKMGRKEEARAIYEEKAKPLCMEATRLMRTASNIASMQAALGEFDPAIEFLKQDIASSEAQKDTVTMMIDMNQLRECYEQKGDFAQAYQTLYRYHELYKWKARKELMGQSAEYLTQFKVQEHQMAQREAESEAHVLKVITIVVSVVLVILFCMFVILSYQFRTIKQRNRALVGNVNKFLDDKKREDQLRAHEQTTPTATNIENDEQMVQLYIYELCSRHLFCKSDFNRDDLLEELHLPKTGFWKLFEEKTGQRFAPYILNLRLEHAAELIREHPEYTIDAIANDSGFSGRSTFYRNFTTRFGISPTVYRGGLQED